MMKREEFVDHLERENFIIRLKGTHLVVQRQPMVRLIRAIRREYLKRIVTCRYRDWEEYCFPRIVAEEVVAATGWLAHHREEAIFLSPRIERDYPPYRDPPYWGGQDVRFRLIDQPQTQPMLLDPIQCPSLYHALTGEILGNAGGYPLPFLAVEHAGGWTYRNEKEPDGIFRGLAFQRVELVWIATEEMSRRILTELLVVTGDFLESFLNLEYVHAYRADCCFAEAGQPYESDSRIELREIRSLNKEQKIVEFPGIDLVIACDGLDNLEVASAGCHVGLPSRFDIKAEGVLPLESGCFGLGLTRVVGEFLRQKGCSKDGWPRAVVAAIDSL